ncbi:MAG: AsmA-like C-terminal domain-containing protein, partial [Desulfobacteraceae bacterium]
ILLDMDLRTGPLELDRLASAFETVAKDRDARSTQGLFGVPLEGTVRLKSESLSYEQFTWAPFHAYIAIAPGEVHVNITEANWCGISTPGVVVATPQEIFLDFQPVAANQPLSPVLNCLPLQHAQMTGNFDLKGHVTARGKAEKLMESLQGDLEFVAKEGRIQRHIPLAKVFAFLNVTEAFRGKPLGFDKEGLAYDSLSVKGKFEKGKLLVKEAVLDGVTMEIAGHGEISLIDKKMDAQILVAPFRTIDWVIKKTPLVGYILAGTLVSIPIKVTGEIDNPKVTPLPASAVGSGLLGMMKRTFKLPIKVIEAVLPKNKK